MRAHSIRHRWAWLLLAAGLTVSVVAATPSDDQWPMFRGPRAGVVDDDPALPETWSREKNVAWKIDVPGVAWSSPIVWGRHVFVTSVISDEPRPAMVRAPDAVMRPHVGAPGNQKPLATMYRWMLYAIDFDTGKIRWERELRRGVPDDPKHPKNTYGSETPVTDGERVYVYHASAGLFAVDFSGSIVWSREIKIPELKADVVTGAVSRRTNSRTSGVFIGNGQAASPALHKDRIFIVADHESNQWFFAAFSTRDGRELWRVQEDKAEESYGWSTPFVWAHALRTEVITVANNGVRSYDPAGKLLWQLKGLSLSTTPTPFAANGLLYASSGYPGDPFRPVYAIRPGASGDISLKEGDTRNQYVSWHQRAAATYMPSAIVYGDYYYSLYSQGFLTCFEAKTGKPVYGRQRIAVDAAAFTASPWAYNGKIFAASEDGDVYVIQAGPDYKLLHTNTLGEMVLATPAVVRGSLVIRTVSSLWRIANTGATGRLRGREGA